MDRADRIIDRLDAFIRETGLNDNIVTRECSLSGGLLSKARSGKGVLTNVTIRKILCRYSNLSPDWFLCNKGQMLRDVESIQEPTVGYGKFNNEIVIISTQAKLIAMLEKDNTELTNANLSKETEIEHLKEEIELLRKEIEKIKGGKK